VRRPIDSKPNTYPESIDVDVTDISGKVSAHYPGRSALCLHSSSPRRQERTKGTARFLDCSAEVSRGHSSCRKDNEGLNLIEDVELKLCQHDQKLRKKAAAGSKGRNP